MRLALDPLSLGELQDLGPFEAPPGGQVEVGDGGLERETGGLDAALQAVVGSAGDLDIDQ